MTGSISAQRKHKPKTALTSLSPAERTAKLLAFKGTTHNFGPKVPEKKIHVASSRFATV